MRFIPLTIALLYPAVSLASGGDVLLLLWLEAVLFVAVVLSVVVSGLPWATRVLLFAAYLAAVLTPLFAIQNMPYTANRLFINIVCIGTPGLIFFGGLFMAMRRVRT
jgi:hypothetical protein